jgi:hypothetical protein
VQRICRLAAVLTALACAATAVPAPAQTVLRGGVSEDTSPASDGFRVNGECLEACRTAATT